jgi:hypothetical protein
MEHWQSYINDMRKAAKRFTSRSGDTILLCDHVTV